MKQDEKEVDMRRTAVVLVAVLIALILSPYVFCQEKEAGEKPEKAKKPEKTEKGDEAVITVREVEPFIYFAVDMTGSYDQHAAAFQTLYAAAGKQGIDMGAVPFGIYYNDPECTPVEELRWEVGFPASGEKEVAEPLKAKKWEYGTVVAMPYEGPFSVEKMGPVYREIYGWIEKNGFKQAGPIMEKYMSMPTLDESGNLSGKIEILMPIQKKEE